MIEKCEHEEKYQGAGWLTPDGSGCIYCHKCNQIIMYEKGLKVR